MFVRNCSMLTFELHKTAGICSALHHIAYLLQALVWLLPLEAAKLLKGNVFELETLSNNLRATPTNTQCHSIIHDTRNINTVTGC